MNIKSANKPRTKDERSYIDIDITLDDGSIYPFTATPCDPLGMELYKKAKRGEFGKVSVTSNSGYYWDGTQWVAPSSDELVTAAQTEQVSRIAIAEAEIAPLERAVRLGMATAEEIDRLGAWERYSVLLSRVDTTKAPDIEWPEAPQ